VSLGELEGQYFVLGLSSGTCVGDNRRLVHILLNVTARHV